MRGDETRCPQSNGADATIGPPSIKAEPQPIYLQYQQVDKTETVMFHGLSRRDIAAIDE